MNKIFSVVRNAVGEMVVASEFAKTKTSKTKKVITSAILCSLLGVSGQGFAAEMANIDASNMTEAEIELWRQKLKAFDDVINNTTININRINEAKGAEIGDGSTARGLGSIATGRGSLAIGKNATATGGGETRQDIVSKLNANRQKLLEIDNLKNKTDNLLKQIQEIRTREALAIEAGERVKSVIKEKDALYKKWKNKENDFYALNSQVGIVVNEAQEKINSLNSKLQGISQLGTLNIHNDTLLTENANRLKSIVEQGTELNLSEEFYKTYIKNHYYALGNLRINQNIYQTLISTGKSQKVQLEPDRGEFAFTIVPNVNGLKMQFLDNAKMNETLLRSSINKYDNDALAISYYSWGKGPYYESSIMDIRENGYYNPIYFLPPTSYQVMNKSNFDRAVAQKNKYKEMIISLVENNDDMFIKSSGEFKSALIDFMNKKIDATFKTNEIAYYQWEYEQTGDLSWLDKKQVAVNEYNQIFEEWKNLKNPFSIRYQLINAWKKENIDDFLKKNDVTIANLTSELEGALNINKALILERQKELADAEKAMEDAKRRHDNLNPADADKALVANYETIMAELAAKSDELQKSQEQLQALKDSLTLHDLSNTGENAMAIGTDALSTGQNSIAMGTGSVVTGENSIAIGKGSVVTGNNSIAVGTGHNVIGHNSGTFGDPNYIYGDGSYAFGNNIAIGNASNTHNEGNNTFVLGSNISTTANNAVILGANSQDGGDNTVSVGSNSALRKIVNVAQGLINNTSTDAINGSQVKKELYGDITVYENLVDVIGNMWAVSDEVTAEVNSLHPQPTTSENVNPSDGAAGASSENTSPSLSSNDNPKNYVRLADGAPTDFVVVWDANASTTRYSWSDGFVELKDGETYRLPSGIELYGNKPGDEVTIKNVTGVLPVQFNLTTLSANGEVNENSTSFHNIKDALVKVVENVGNLSTNIGTLLKSDMSNLSDNGQKVIRQAVNKVFALQNGTNTTVEKSTADNGVTTYKVNVSSDAIKSIVDTSNITNALNGKMNADGSDLTEAQLQAFRDKLGGGQAQEGDTRLVTGDVLYKTVQTRATEDDINVVVTKVNNTTSTLNEKLDADLSNLSDEGKKKARKQLTQSVVLKAGDKITVDKSTDDDGVTTYTVGASNDAIKEALNSALNEKVGLNGISSDSTSALSSTDVAAWQAKLGTGQNQENNKGLITGDVLNQALATKVDKTTLKSLTTQINGQTVLLTGKLNNDLSNIDNTGIAKLREYAIQAVKITSEEGSNVSINTEKDSNGNITSIISVTNEDIKNAVKTDLGALANKDASSLTANEIVAYQAKLGNGKVEKGNAGLITGDVFKKALDNKADISALNEIQSSNSNVKSSILTKVSNTLDDLSADGIAKIKTLTKEAINVQGGDNFTVSSSVDTKSGVKNYSISLSNDTIKTAIQNGLDAKANREANNLSKEDIASWRAVLGGGEVKENNTAFVSASTVKDALDAKVDKSVVDELAKAVGASSGAQSGKLNKELSNINNDGIAVIKSKAQEAITIKAGNNVLIDENIDASNNKVITINVDENDIKSAIKPELDAKASIDVNGMTEEEVAAWQEKLGNGKVEQGNTGIVNGGEVYLTVQKANEKIVEVAKNVASVSTTYFAEGANIINPPVYLISDMQTGQIFAHDNIGTAIDSLNTNNIIISNAISGIEVQQQQFKKDLKEFRKDAFAGTASALAATGLSPAVKPGKTTISAAGAIYKGQYGYAVGIAKMSENGAFSANANVSGNSRGDFGVTVGVGFRFN